VDKLTIKYPLPNIRLDPLLVQTSTPDLFPATPRSPMICSTKSTRVQVFYFEKCSTSLMATQNVELITVGQNIGGCRSLTRVSSKSRTKDCASLNRRRRVHNHIATIRILCDWESSLPHGYSLVLDRHHHDVGYTPHHMRHHTSH